MLAAVQLLLMFPAVLFMGALVMRQVSPLQEEPAYTAHQVVMWYAARIWTLWALLITLPLVVLVTGGVTMLRSYGPVSDRPTPTRQGRGALSVITVMTLMAGVVLAIVALHMAAN